MSMQIINVVQGTPAWHAHRARHWNASDAPAMLGCSPYKTREALLRERATGIAKEHDESTQRLFDGGHRSEALARPLAEELIGQELFPVTGSEGPYSASFDGVTMDETTLFEHKSLNNELRNVMPSAAGASVEELPLHYRAQMEHQLLVSGAQRVLFMATQWTGDDVLVEKRWCWYEPDPELRDKIVRGWEQFAADLAAYTPPADLPAITKQSVTSLPAVTVQVGGALTVRHNFDVLEQRMRAFIDGLPKQPATDDEFGVAEAAVKTLENAEGAIKAALDGAVAQSASLEEVVRIGRGLQEQARTTRLALDKLVKARKETIRAEIVGKAVLEMADHVSKLNARLGATWVKPPPAGAFAEAIKGLKTLASVRDKCAQATANEKIAASELADRLDANRKALVQDGADYMFLFADFASVGVTTADVFSAIAGQRIGNHKAAEAERQRKAEEARRDAEERAEAQRAHERMLIENHTPPGTHSAPAAPSAAPQTPEPATAGLVPSASVPSAGLPPDGPPTLRLGQIAGRLGLGVTEGFLAGIGFPAAGSDKAARLYHEAQFQAMCARIAEHVLSVGESHQ